MTKPPDVLRDHVELLTGYPFKSKQYTDNADGVRLLRGDNVAQGRLRWDGAKRWPADLSGEQERYRLVPGDVVLAMDRPWIEAGLKYATLRPADTPALLVQRVARLRACNGLCQEFLPYLIGSEAFTAHVRAVQTGTAVPHISGTQIGEFAFHLPSESTQAAIAEVLGALDEKIDLNQRSARTSAGIAQLELQRRLSQASENRSLASIAEITLGSSPPGSSYNEVGEGLPFYQGTRDFGLRYPSRRVYCTDPKRVAQPGDVLISVRAPVGSVNAAVERCIIGRGVAAATAPHPSLLIHALQASEDAWAPYESEGTVFGAINGKALRSLPIQWLPDDAVDCYESFARPLDDLTIQLLRENETLAKLRDALLPKLLSGELRVGEAEEVAGEAGV